MNLFIKLTTAGATSGPFNLYSDRDSYNIPFESNVPKQDLLDGYISYLVPANTAEVRIKSNNVLCTTYINVFVTAPLTTTSTSSTTTTTTTVL